MAVISHSNSHASYNTTGPALQISSLECGVDYSLTVMSFNGTCVSQPTELPVRQSKRALPTASTINVPVNHFFGCAKLMSLPQCRACPPMWLSGVTAATILQKWLGKQARVPCHIKPLQKTKMEGTYCALPMGQRAGWRAWCAARFTALESLPWKTTAPVMRVQQWHSKQVGKELKTAFCQGFKSD